LLRNGETLSGFVEEAVRRNVGHRQRRGSLPRPSSYWSFPFSCRKAIGRTRWAVPKELIIPGGPGRCAIRDRKPTNGNDSAGTHQLSETTKEAIATSRLFMNLDTG
jgi:hypothetical protein